MSAITRSRQQSSAAVWVGAGVALSALGGMAGNLLVPRVLPVRGAADFFFLTSVIAVCCAVARVGLDRAIVKEVASARVSGDRAAVGRVVRVGLLTAGAIMVGAALIVVAAWPLVGSHLHSDGSAFTVLLAASLWAGFEAARLLVSECLRGSNRIASATIFGDAGRGLLFLLMVIAMLASGIDRLVVVIVVAAVASALVLLGALGAVGFEYRSELRLGFRWRGARRAGGALIAASAPFYITALCAFVTSQGDIMVGGFTLPGSDLAFYAAASKLALVLALPLVAVTLLLAPVIPGFMASHDQRGLETSARRSAMVAAAMVVPACVLCMVHGSWLMGLIYPPAYAAGGVNLAILSVGSLATACTGPNGFVLLMADDDRYVARTTLGVSVVQLVAMILLAAMWGPIGLAVASTSGTVVLNLLFAFRIRTTLGIRTDVLTSPRRLFTRGYVPGRHRVANSRSVE